MRLHDINYGFWLTAVLVCFASCAIFKDRQTTSIAVIDGKPISTEEFLYVYNKNNQRDNPVTRSEIRDYLDLFVNFKLKVLEAESLGLHLDSSFISELEGYRKQIADPYLAETRLLDSLSHITYQRLSQEVKASHILFRVAETATPADTLAVYQKLIALRKQIIKGLDFNQAALEHSEDPSAKQNRGLLGYFTAMQMVYPLEEAAYQLAIDSISQPVRTSFGYHLIKVHQRRPSQGRIQVSHILVRANDQLSPSDSTLAANRAWEIYRRVKNQENWELLCRQFSEDIGTKMKGGTLPWFKTGDISNIPEFEKAAFQLNAPGDISEPIKTGYGWHIIRLENKQGLEAYEALEPKIRASLSANSRARLNQVELVKRLKSENNFDENQSVILEAYSHASDSLTKGTWDFEEGLDHLDKVLFRINQDEYTIRQFYQYLKNKQHPNSAMSAPEIMEASYQDFTKNCLIKYEEEHLANKYYDYKMLIKEYRDGILLFQLMEDKVWNHAIKDTSGLKRYFEENIDRYQWEERATATIYNVSNNEAVDEVKQYLEQGYFIINQYDFYSNEKTFNKAQLKILDNISQLLVQMPERKLLLKYDFNNQAINRIYDAILAHLQKQNVDSTRIKQEPLPSGSLEFLVYTISSSLKDFETNMNKEDPLTMQVEKGKYQAGDNQFIDRVQWNTGLHQFESDDRLVLVNISGILPKDPQKLEEIKGQVISDYQTVLEEEWVRELRNKYLVEINEKEVDAIYEQYRN